MSFILKCEVRHVKSAKDKYEQPVVDLDLRTDDFQGMLLAKYIAQGLPVTIKVIEGEDGSS